MRFRIVNTELETNDTFTKSIEKKALGLVAAIKVPIMKRNVSKAMQEAARALPKSVGDILARGVGPLSAGNKTVSYASPFGDGRFRTKSWRTLTRDYREQSPKSRKFWMKHPGGGTYRKGRGANRRDVDTLLKLFREAADSKVKIRSGKTQTHDATKKTKRITWDVNMSTSAHPVLREMMYLAMFTGITQKASTLHDDVPRLGSIDNKTIEKIAYVEGRRPLIRGVSHAIGQKANKRIKQIIRPKI